MKRRPAIDRQIVLPASPERVWSALTEGSNLSRWFGAEVELEARRGGSAIFRWPEGHQREATVEEMDPPRRLSFRWAPFERTGSGARVVPATRVEFTLEAAPEGTLLTVSERRLEDSALAAPSDPVFQSIPEGRPPSTRLWSALRVPIR
jgi:uncharacterized protein YndB with AHSA1/START domain